MRSNFTRFFLFSLIFLNLSIYSQDLKIFGFAQTFYRNSVNTEQNVSGKFGAFVSPNGAQTFAVQQLNIMGSNNFGSGFSAFVNLQFTDNYDNRKLYGNLDIQEVFAKYTNQDGTFQVKFGSFLPKFNSMYEVFNRFPLIPYITRPFIYEPSLYSYFSVDDFLPYKGNLQIFGEKSFSDNFTLEYAAFVANPELSFNNQQTGASSGGGGYNQTTNLSVGGRIGFNFGLGDFGNLVIGNSYNSDVDNLKSMNYGINLAPVGIPNDTLGDVARLKIGADLTYTIGGFSLKGELVSVNYSPTDEQTIKIENKLRDVYKTSEYTLDKLFYFVTGQYTFLEDITVFATYSLFKDNANAVFSQGMTILYFGLNYSLTPNLLLKAQYAKLTLNDLVMDGTINVPDGAGGFNTIPIPGVDGTPIKDAMLDVNQILIGASIMF